MTRAKLLVVGLGIALLALFAAPAGAQDGPTITVEPASVDAAGEATFTVTGAGWTAAPPIFVLPCEAPESGDVADLDQATCDTGNLTPATPDADGNFTVDVTFEVGEFGLAIAAGDAGQTETAAALVTLGGGDDGAAADDAAADDAAADDAAADDAAADDAAADDAAADDGEAATTDAEALPATGVETSVLAILGAAVLAAGLMVFGFSRRFTRA